MAVIPGGRHLTPLECPKEIADLLEDLIGRAHDIGECVERMWTASGSRIGLPQRNCAA